MDLLPLFNLKPGTNMSFVILRQLNIVHTSENCINCSLSHFILHF